MMSVKIKEDRVQITLTVKNATALREYLKVYRYRNDLPKLHPGSCKDYETNKLREMLHFQLSSVLFIDAE